MSAFIDRMEVVWNGRQAAPEWCGPSRLITGSCKQCAPCLGEYEIRRTYELKTSYHQRITCEPSHLERAIHNAKHKLAHEIYGEFYDHLLDLEMAVLDQDSQECQKILSIIMHLVRGG